MVVFLWMDVLPEDTIEQVTHKIQGGIKPCNISLYIVDSFCNCGKTVNQLLLEEYRPWRKWRASW